MSSSKLEIGFIAGSHKSLDRRMEAVRAVIQETVRPHHLISVPSTLVRPELPVIVDLSVESAEVKSAVQSFLAGHVVRPWLFIRLSERIGIPESWAEMLKVSVYRNPINVKPAVLRFLERYPSEIIVPVTHYAVSSEPLRVST